MIPPELVVLLAGGVIGVVRRAAGDRLSFVYDDWWRDSEGAYPLSLSLPLLEREHGDAPVRAYLEGLLPDREEVRASWGRRYGVSAHNAYGLLAHVGEDCPGAVQFAPRDRIDHLITGSSAPPEWLSDADIAERLQDSIRVYSTGAPAHGTGNFSIAGAQPKIVLYRDGERWAVPSAALASTHLLKPPALDLEQFATNEHLCLLLAGEIGLTVAKSEVLAFEGEVAIVVERFDRVPQPDGGVHRIHQEDFCQALGVRPASKYESEGGPGAVDCARLLIQHATDPDGDLPAFLDSLALSWVILGTDAHAKNYALCYTDIRPSLAPLYDVISVLPYPQVTYAPRAKLAMRIGGEYRASSIKRRHWIRFAEDLEVDRETVVDRVTALVHDIPQALDRVRARISGSGLDEAFAEGLLDLIEEQVPQRLRALESDVAPVGDTPTA